MRFYLGTWATCSIDNDNRFDFEFALSYLVFFLLFLFSNSTQNFVHTVKCPVLKWPTTENLFYCTEFITLSIWYLYKVISNSKFPFTIPFFSWCCSENQVVTQAFTISFDPLTAVGQHRLTEIGLWAELISVTAGSWFLILSYFIVQNFRFLHFLSYSHSYSYSHSHFL